MEVLLMLIMGTACVVCFVIGAKVGQTVCKGEDIKLPTINPMEMAKEYRNKKEAQKEQRRLDTILQNIEGYDGTSRGQVDVPKG